MIQHRREVLNKLTEDAVLSASRIILTARYTLRDGANPCSRRRLHVKVKILIC